MDKDQIIDKVYNNYLNEWTFEKHPNDGSVYSVEPIKVKEHTKEQFVYRCKTNLEFSKKWGLKIEEKELSLEERKRIYEMEYTNDIEVENNHWLESKLKTRNIPTKKITLEYNNEKTYCYE